MLGQLLLVCQLLYIPPLQPSSQMLKGVVMAGFYCAEVRRWQSSASLLLVS